VSEEIWVKCKICGEGFDSYEALIAHIYSHIEESQKVKNMSDVDCLFKENCLDYPRLCGRCARNKGKKHYFKPMD